MGPVMNLLYEVDTKCTGEDVRLKFRQGDTWSRRFIWQRNGTNLNLQYTEAVFNMVNANTGESVLKVYSDMPTENGYITIYPDKGFVDVYVNNTENYGIGVYSADLKLLFLDSTVQSTPPFFIEVEDDADKLITEETETSLPEGVYRFG